MVQHLRTRIRLNKFIPSKSPLTSLNFIISTSQIGRSVKKHESHVLGPGSLESLHSKLALIPTTLAE